MTDIDMTVATAPAVVPEPSTALAPAVLDGEWVSREARIQMLEAQAADLRDRYVRSTVELGAVLCEHRDLCREEGERVTALLARLGFTPSHAYQLMRVSTVVKQLPSLRDLADRQYSHALTLIQGADDDLLRQIATGSSEELPLDDVGKMSVRQLRQRVRQLTTDAEVLARRENRALRAERDALVKDRDRLAALTGDDLDSIRRVAQGLRKQVGDVGNVVSGLHRQLEAVALVEAQSERGQIVLDQVERDLQDMIRMLQGVWTTWMERRDQDWGRADEYGDTLDDADVDDASVGG